ncbi:hypothetical protein [Novosphingobium sp. MBES04]|uniref:hypothetical protein n=1 Tax=Novosphingobium sp. MBES04 TaxID=1206458 RepID=UPI0006932321|nr:hypothetical protein [Novosphingobium sp. MBES04]GAM06684.1 hypothetical protein MBENS4_3680 [Novosphingobium sp. MBES04]
MVSQPLRHSRAFVVDRQKAETTARRHDHRRARGLGRIGQEGLVTGHRDVPEALPAVARFFGDRLVDEPGPIRVHRRAQRPDRFGSQHAHAVCLQAGRSRLQTRGAYRTGCVQRRGQGQGRQGRAHEQV